MVTNQQVVPLVGTGRAQVGCVTALGEGECPVSGMAHSLGAWGVAQRGSRVVPKPGLCCPWRWQAYDVSSLASGQLSCWNNCWSSQSCKLWNEDGDWKRRSLCVRNLAHCLFRAIQVSVTAFTAQGHKSGGPNFPSICHQFTTLLPASLSINWTQRSLMHFQH